MTRRSGAPFAGRCTAGRWESRRSDQWRIRIGFRPWPIRWLPSGICQTCSQRVLEEQLIPVLLEILTGGTGLVLFRNPRGFDERTKTKYGLAPGAADYVGLYKGRYVEIEFKTPLGRQSPDQKAHQQLIASKQGYYSLCRSEDDARRILKELAT